MTGDEMTGQDGVPREEADDDRGVAPRPDRGSRAAVPPRRPGAGGEPTEQVAIEEPGPSAGETVWRADHDRVSTGPLRPHGTTLYNPEDEPLQDVDDRPARTTRGRPASDGAGLSTAEPGDAKTGSRTHDGQPLPSSQPRPPDQEP